MKFTLIFFTASASIFEIYLKDKKKEHIPRMHSFFYNS